MTEELQLRSKCHPESNGRRPLPGESEWGFRLDLEDGRKLTLSVGEKGRNTLFGMMLTESHDSGDGEPVTISRPMATEIIDLLSQIEPELAYQRTFNRTPLDNAIQALKDALS